MISVIVPVYNVEKYIEKCVESILTQSYRDFEIILVDDGATDSSGKICDKLCETDSRIKVVHQSNQGLSAARNTGLDNMQGEYVTFIDSDDYIENDYLQCLYENVTSQQAEISVCGHRIVEENKKIQVQETADAPLEVCTGREAACKIVKDSSAFMITACGKLFHACLKEFLYFPAGKVHEDEFVIYKALYAAKRVTISQRPLYCYVQHTGSITNSRFSIKRLDKLKALKEAITYFEDLGDEDLKWYAVKRYLLNIQIAWYRMDKYLPAEKAAKTELWKEWKRVYHSYKEQILARCGLVDKVAVYVYLCWPKAYGVIAGITKLLFPRI